MHLLLSPPGDEPHLRAELVRQFPEATVEEQPGGVFLLSDPPSPDHLRLPLVFARQLLPLAIPAAASSINAWSQVLLDWLIRLLPSTQSWRLAIAPHYGSGSAGLHRCRLIRNALIERLRRHRRQMLRRLVEGTGPFSDDESYCQLLLTSPDAGFVSLATGPLPSQLRGRLVPADKGNIAVASDKAAPCRAFAKLVEAEQRLGIPIQPGDTCVDLGASPGSWTYWAVARGARVLAVDRAPLRDDLPHHPAVQFQQGDAFSLRPDHPVDWLLCDVIAAPERSIQLLLDWLRQRWCRRFVVTIKFKGTEDYERLDLLKRELPALCPLFVLTRLCANKNEACAAGVTDETSPPRNT